MSATLPSISTLARALLGKASQQNAEIVLRELHEQKHINLEELSELIHGREAELQMRLALKLRALLLEMKAQEPHKKHFK